MEAGRIAPSCVLPVFPSAAKGGKAHGESRHAAQMDSGAADRGHGRAGGRILVVDHVDAAVAAQIPFFERHSIKSSCIDCDRRGAECAPRLSGAALHSDLDVVLPCPVAEELPLVACD